MEFDFNPSPELLQKANEAQTPEEFRALAKENGMDITPEQAREYFDRLHKTGELEDDELENVAGGCGGDGGPSPEEMKKYLCIGTRDDTDRLVCQYYKCRQCGQGQQKYRSLTHIGSPHLFHNVCCPSTSCQIFVKCLYCEHCKLYETSRSYFYYCDHKDNMYKKK